MIDDLTVGRHIICSFTSGPSPSREAVEPYGCVGRSLMVYEHAAAVPKEKARSVLARLYEAIPALGMHDGLNVRRADKEEAMEVMRAVTQRMLGVALHRVNIRARDRACGRVGERDSKFAYVHMRAGCKRDR